MDDWDSVVLLESSWYDLGYGKATRESIEDQDSYCNGFSSGVLKGFELGSEASFYEVTAQLYLETEQSSGSNPRLIEKLKDIIQKAEEFPAKNDATFNFTEKLDKLRNLRKSNGKVLDIFPPILGPSTEVKQQADGTDW